MGLIKGGGIFILGVSLFIVLLASQFLFTMSNSLTYDVVEPHAKKVAYSLIESTGSFDKLDENWQGLEKYCEIKSKFDYESSFYNVSIPCHIIKSGQNATIDFVIEKGVENFYYQDYNCKIKDCLLEKKVYILISERMKNASLKYFNYSIYVILLLSGLVFLLYSQKQDALILVGILFVLSSLLFSQLDILIKLFPEMVESLMKMYFVKTSFTFVLYLIIGIVLFLVGISIKFFDFGVYLSRIFSIFRFKVSKKKKKGQAYLSEELLEENLSLRKELKSIKEKMNKSKKN